VYSGNWYCAVNIVGSVILVNGTSQPENVYPSLSGSGGGVYVPPSDI
jgi:hypothetical protein